MNRVEHLSGQAGHHARRAGREARPWVRPLARAGYAAKGVLYIAIGILAAMAAFGGGGDGATTGSKGAIRAIQEQPFGQVLLVMLTVGLAGYALWRLVQAILDPEGEGTDAKGAAKRAGRFVSGLLHGGLVVYTLGLLTGGALGGAGGGGGAESWTARFMSWPAGRWIVGAAGIAVVAFAGYQLYKAYKADLDDELRLGEMKPRSRRWAIGVSRFGIAARGAVAVVVGIALIVAAAQTDPSEAKGLGQALASIQAMTLGWLLLGIVALGLVAYGAYELVRAKYRRIQLA